MTGSVRAVRRWAASALVVALGCLLAAVACAGASPQLRWRPPQKLTWYWQLQGPVRLGHAVQAYDLDGFDTPSATVSALHRAGRHVVCYIDVGTWESWRPDAGRFPRALLGAPNGWPGERWLDVHRLSVLAPIMTSRLRMCQDKGFDAVEPDNIDGWLNDTGFAISGAEQIAYDTWVARAAHADGLAVFQKNDPEQTRRLEGDFDGALVEQCRQFAECAAFGPYLAAHKPVLDAEYRSSLYPAFCAPDRRAGMMGALYALSLDGSIFRPCS